MTKISSVRSCGPVDIEIGIRMKAMRKKINMSQETLAGHLGMTFQQIQKYEKGTNRISASTLIAMAKIFDVRPGALIDDIAVGDFS